MDKTIKAITMATVVMMLAVCATPMMSGESDAAGWSEGADQSWYEEGQNTFTLTNAAQLAGLAQLVNKGNTFNGKTITLGADIDLDGLEWTPIGSKDKPFAGTFDGDGKTVSNLVIGSGTYLGLFGNINTPATIENLNIRNVSITGTSVIGALVGSGHTGAITNCSISGLIQIEGNYKVGGLSGHSYAAVTDCRVDGDVSSYVIGTYQEADLEGDNVGGLIGYRGEGGNTVSGCSVSGITVEGTRKVGGLIGSAFTNNNIDGCSVTSTIVRSNASSEYINTKPESIAIGGMVGLYNANGNNDGKMENCEVSDVALESDNEGVQMGYLTGGQRGTDSVESLPNTFTQAGNESDAQEFETGGAFIQTVDGNSLFVTTTKDTSVTFDVTFGTGATISFSGTATGNAISLGVRPADVIGNDADILYNVTISGVEASQFTIGLPYTVLSGQVLDDLDVFYYPDSGSPVNMNASARDGLAVFTTDHTSLYGIVLSTSTVQPPVVDDDDDLPPFIPTQPAEDDSVTIVACAAAAVVAALMAVFLILTYRKD